MFRCLPWESGQHGKSRHEEYVEQQSDDDEDGEECVHVSRISNSGGRVPMIFLLRRPEIFACRVDKCRCSLL